MPFCRVCMCEVADANAVLVTADGRTDAYCAVPVPGTSDSCWTQQIIRMAFAVRSRRIAGHGGRPLAAATNR